MQELWCARQPLPCRSFEQSSVQNSLEFRLYVNSTDIKVSADEFAQTVKPDCPVGRETEDCDPAWMTILKGIAQ